MVLCEGRAGRMLLCSAEPAISARPDIARKLALPLKEGQKLAFASFSRFTEPPVRLTSTSTRLELKKPPKGGFFNSGAPDRIRTGDLLRDREA